MQVVEEPLIVPNRPLTLPGISSVALENQHQEDTEADCWEMRSTESTKQAYAASLLRSSRLYLSRTESVLTLWSHIPPDLKLPEDQMMMQSDTHTGTCLQHNNFCFSWI